MLGPGEGQHLGWGQEARRLLHGLSKDVPKSGGKGGDRNAELEVVVDYKEPILSITYWEVGRGEIQLRASSMTQRGSQPLWVFKILRSHSFYLTH